MTARKRTNAWQGVQCFFEGLNLVFKPGIRGIVVIPLAINILLFAGGMLLALRQYGRWLEGIESKLPNWLDWLTFLLWPMLFLATLVAMAYTFTTVANLVASPFNGLLSERVERHLKRGQSPLPPAGGWGEMWRTVPRSIWRELVKIAYYVPRALLCLVLFLVPFAGQTVAPVIWFLFSAWMMAAEYSDYACDNARLPLPRLRATMRAHRTLSLGFGSMVAVVSMVPLINLLVMPVSVCGGTALWVRHMESTARLAEENRVKA